MRSPSACFLARGSVSRLTAAPFGLSTMELAISNSVEENSTLSWYQLGLCGLCCLCCYGLGKVLMWMLTRLVTKGQRVASILKLMVQDGLRQAQSAPGGGHNQMASVAVKDQGAQTELQVPLGSSLCCPSPKRSPDLGHLSTPSRRNYGGGRRPDILLDMARRAQPVLAEVEARQVWSTMSREDRQPNLDRL